MNPSYSVLPQKAPENNLSTYSAFIVIGGLGGKAQQTKTIQDEQTGVF